ncbi:MAG: ABC transporter ATP-binding protein [Desulfovibrionaceae bacterium]|nr:ABC transporter ATP-binding protein [Desulfovibrionaceae bacterium]
MRDIRRSFKVGEVDVEILKGVNLDVDKGELLSIMGTSGGGKSTLMNIIGLLDAPTSGQYLLEGRDVTKLTDAELSDYRNRQIGFVFQQFNLLQRLTALDNVGLPLVYRGVSTQERRERAMELLDKVGMADRAHHKPTELSGGQQQRVAIARAFVGRPSIIMGDEPTGALDTQVGQEIMNLFIQLNKEEGVTVMLITHDPGIAKQCNRVVRMKDGVVQEA